MWRGAFLGRATKLLWSICQCPPLDKCHVWNISGGSCTIAMATAGSQNTAQSLTLLRLVQGMQVSWFSFFFYQSEKMGCVLFSYCHLNIFLKKNMAMQTLFFKHFSDLFWMKKSPHDTSGSQASFGTGAYWGLDVHWSLCYPSLD